MLTSLRTLLSATAARPAQLGCFGMHEWAMVYRLPADEVRHADWPLRLGSAGTDEVVESHRIGCSHFDAFRFFTDEARPFNRLDPRHDDRPAFEQPGCLHAGMDLYKHAFRLSPLVCSDLVADCFELARDIRVLDMRASPYDLSGLGYEPVRGRDRRRQAGVRHRPTGLRRACRAAASAAARRVRPPARRAVTVPPVGRMRDAPGPLGGCERPGAPVPVSPVTDSPAAPDQLLRLVSQDAFGDPTPVTSSQPRLTASEESWLNVRTL